MCLCSNYGGIENIFHWYPQNDQWWITGFNPEHVGKVDVHKQVMVGSVDFSENEELYKNFKVENENRSIVKDFLIFDKDNLTVWLCWH